MRKLVLTLTIVGMGIGMGWGATAIGGETIGVLVAQALTSQQQQKLDALYAKAEAEGKGKSKADREKIYRAYMPGLIEIVAPGTQPANYAAALASNSTMKQAQIALARRLGFSNEKTTVQAGGRVFDDIPFYP